MTTHSLTPVRAQQRLRREEDAGVREQKLEKEAVAQAGATHASVMVDEVLNALDLKKGEFVVDATAGMGGHSEAMLNHAPVQVLALDADPEAVAATTERLKRFGERVHVIQANFGDLGKILKHEKVASINKALFDLGWNMTQLASGRGFSFMRDEPLLMSYGKKPASGFTARELLNTWDEKVLADVFFGYGEERYARRIAKAVVERRALQPIETTLELVEIIRDAVPGSYRHGRINPATRTFQALRIATNDELGSIEAGVTAAWEHLAPGGRIAVLSFHSIEDRAVKRLFAKFAKEGGKLVVKKPLVASREEVLRNSPSRSAKLRAIEKLA